MLSNADALTPGAEFMPHGMCYLWQPGILGLHVVADLLITLGYLSISGTLIYFVAKRRGLEFKWIFVLFAIFILACGITHLFEIWVIWHPDYWLSGISKAITALASVATAVLLLKLLPIALALPSSTIFRGRLAAIVDSSDDAIISKTLNGIITSWNDAAVKIFGYPQSEVIGRPVTMIFPPDRVDEETDILRRVARGERIANFETVRVRKDGAAIDVSATISPILDGDGTIVGASKIARDITEKKRAAQALAEQAQILDLTQVIVRDPQGKILRWNRGAQALYGYTPGQAVGRISHELFRTQFPEPLAGIMERLERTGGWEGELIHTRRDGTQIHVASIWVLHRDAHGRPARILESNTDVTERRRAEQTLAAQLSRLSLLHTITRAIGERQDLPSIFRVLLGTLQDNLPIDFCCICLFQPPDDLRVAEVGARSRDMAAQMELSEHARVPLDQDGLSRCVRGEFVYEPDLSTAKFPFPERLAAAGLSTMVAAPLLIEHAVFAVLIVAKRASHGFTSGECEFLSQLSAHVALAAHQTRLHESLQAAYEDLRQTQQAIMRQEKLRVLAQMASGIAHDINNALSPAALFVEMLLDRETNLTAEATESLVIIQRAIEGVAQTVARMREFYSERDPQRAQESVDLNRAVEQVLDLTRSRWQSMPEKSGFVIQVFAQLATDLPAVLADESEIRDALANLILNAVDAMPEGGNLTITTHVVELGRIQIEVSDTGIGMDEATRSRCLELFFTTKGVRGSGLGLAMVYGAVERHGGDLQIDSTLGAGTTIRMTFPAAPAASGSRAVPSARESSRPLHILVIDDDILILQSLLTTLGKDGHTAESAEGGLPGIEAFTAATERGDPYDLVVTDLGMPHIDGRAVAAAVKAARPQTPVILLTGWGHRLLAEHDFPPGVDRVLAKPPTMAALRTAIAELVGTPP
jgi:PAS domain S-box-containing protein